MKKIILFIVLAAAFAACKTSTRQDDKTITDQAYTDTAGLAEYQAWKQQKEQLQPIEMNAVNGANNATQNGGISEANEAKPVTRIIYRDRIKVPKVEKYAAPQPQYTEPSYTPPKPVGQSREAVSRNDAMIGNGGAGNGADSAAGAGNTNGAIATNTENIPRKNNGWSKAAKGTAIGAASGAVLGAIISKNKVTGAIIGGVAGGLGGYAIGRSKDKKDGRYLVSNN